MKRYLHKKTTYIHYFVFDAMYASAKASAASLNSGKSLRLYNFMIQFCTNFFSALPFPVINFLSSIGVNSFIFILCFKHRVINIALIPNTNSALFWLNFVKKSFSIHMVWTLFFLSNFVKYFSISLILANWSILVGDFISDNKIPESIIFRSDVINAYHSFLTPGSIPNITI